MNWTTVALVTLLAIIALVDYFIFDLASTVGPGFGPY